MDESPISRTAHFSLESAGLYTSFPSKFHVPMSLGVTMEVGLVALGLVSCVCFLMLY